MADVVEIFFNECVCSQAIESKIVMVDSDSKFAQRLEASRRRLGHATNSMIGALLPKFKQNPRLFRAKYTDELNLNTLQDCLFSAANKVFDMPLSDQSLKSARPTAKHFLDTVAHVQTIVSIAKETYCKQSTPVHLDSDCSVLPGCSGIPVMHQSDIEHEEERQTVPIVPQRRRQLSSDSQSPTVELRNSPRSNSSTSLPVFPFVATLNVINSLTPTQLFAQQSKQPTTSAPGLLTYMREQNLLLMFIDLLEELDQSMAAFEFALVSSVSRRLRTVSQVADLHEVAVLFSETIMWSLAVGLIDQGRLSDRDPMILISLPRLAVFVGCFLLPDCPIGPNYLSSGRRPPFMFADSVKDLTYLSRQLGVLRVDQLWRLACWLSPFGLSDCEANTVRDLINRLPWKSKCSRLLPWLPTVVKADATLVGGKGSPANFKATVEIGDAKFSEITWNTLGLHNIYKRISNVTGLFSTNFPTEYRDILQLAIEMNDIATPDGEEGSITRSSPNFYESGKEAVSTVRQPLCPIVFFSTGSGDAEKRLGFIRGVDLRQVLNWNKAVFGENRPLCHLLYESTEFSLPNKNQPSLTPSTAFIKPEHCRLSLEDLLSNDFEELGVDVAASVDFQCSELEVSTNKTLPANPSVTRRHNQQLMSLLLPDLIEGEVEGVPNSVYTLPVWQPDDPLMSSTSSSARSEQRAITVSGRQYCSSDNDANGVDEEEGVVSSDSDTMNEGSGRRPRWWRHRWATAARIGKECVACKLAFTLIRRRHHCRRCGHIFCAACCNHWAPVESLCSSTPVRVCADCAEFVLAGLTEHQQQRVIQASEATQTPL